MLQYLLGESRDGPTAADIEYRLLADDQAFAEMLAIEDELIESYLENRLSPEDRARFETAFLSSDRRRERVANHRTLRAISASQSKIESATTRWRWIAAAALVIAVISLAAWYREYRTNGDLQRVLLARMAQSVALAPAEATFSLRHSRARSASDRQWIAFSTRTHRVTFHLDLPEAAQNRPLLAKLETVEGAQVWGGEPMRQGPKATVVVPGGVLSPGDYILLLESRGHSVASYNIRLLVR